MRRRVEGNSRGRRVPGAAPAPAAAGRRWPWIVGAALVGGAAGKVAAALARRVQGEDAPGAVEPDELEAVVDRPHADPPASPSASTGSPPGG